MVEDDSSYYPVAIDWPYASRCMFPAKVSLREVGPREGFQFEGIGRPEHISLDNKLRLIGELARTGLRTLEVASFVHPRQVPQVADAEALCARLPDVPGVRYTGLYLNDVGLRRAIATGKLSISGELLLAASETFARKNQNRTFAQDLEAQPRLVDAYREHDIAIGQCTIAAAFGCNYEGDVPLSRVLSLIESLMQLVAAGGGDIRCVTLADTMGWANPEQVRRSIGAIRERWPDLSVALHLHDTRGLAITNVYAALLDGVDRFDTAVGGLGGCPFAGHRGAAGNVCTEEVVFLCNQLGIETGVDLEALVSCARTAQEIVGHELPSSLIRSSLRFQLPKS